MKTKLLTLATLVAAGFSMNAANLEVVSVEKLDLGSTAHHPVVSPDGSRVLFTSVNHTGLKSLDIASGEVVLLDSREGAGFEPVFSVDGKDVLYRTNSYEDGLLVKDMKRVNIETGNAVQVLEPSRKRVQTRAMAAKAGLKTSSVYAYAQPAKQSISVSVDGLVKEINPIETGYRYLWASVSPSKDKLLFNDVYSGLYVSNLDGSKAKHLTTRGEFPCWAGDKYVVAIYTEDDGYVVTKASVIAIDVETGVITELTGKDVIVDGVSASSDKIVYTTEQGDMYLMNIKIAE